jgi:hypothetical protein
MMKFFTLVLLLLLPGLAPVLADQILIPAGSTWKYLANGSNQGTGWRSATFYDGGWPGGRAQLGYGDGDEVHGGQRRPVHQPVRDHLLPQILQHRRRFGLHRATPCG